jgi:hypothetical protein
MANNYTNAEMADMQFMYGLPDGNTREASRLNGFPATGSWRGVCSVGFGKYSTRVRGSCIHTNTKSHVVHARWGFS